MRVRGVTGERERCQSALELIKGRVCKRQDGGSLCKRRVKVVVSFLRVWEKGGIATM